MLQGVTKNFKYKLFVTYCNIGSEELLSENIIEFVKTAARAKENGSYNSAVTLFFKALAVICDLHILKKQGFVPKNHTERFRVLRADYRELYHIVNKDFPLYQQSYKLRVGREYADVLENDTEQAAKITGIKIHD
ncbi:MAG: hypothetical protein R6U32_00560 [Candidatus Woesearchaeota archaeon]